MKMDYDEEITIFEIIVLKYMVHQIIAIIKHITAVSTRNATSYIIKSHKFYHRPRTGALRLVTNIEGHQ
jgi:hypothetical protein